MAAPARGPVPGASAGAALGAPRVGTAPGPSIPHPMATGPARPVMAPSAAPGMLDAPHAAPLTASADENSGEIQYANQIHRPVPRALILSVLSIVLVLIGILPAVLVIAGTSGNSDLSTIDQLAVPAWAEAAPVDHAIGNPWCLSSCRKTERTASSTHPVGATAAAYGSALRAAGWTPAPATACPPATKGTDQSCWVLDRRQLNVLVIPSPCAVAPPPTTEPGLTDPPIPAPRTAPKSGCAPTTVEMSLFDRIDLDLHPARS
jgi:hypothetical protein